MPQLAQVVRRALRRVVGFCVAFGIASGLGYALGVSAALGLTGMLARGNARPADVASLPRCVEAKTRPEAGGEGRMPPCRDQSGAEQLARPSRMRVSEAK